MHRKFPGAAATAMTVATMMVALSGCSWFGGGDNGLVCPRAVIAPEIGRVSVFASGNPVPVMTGEVTGVAATCRKTDKGIVSDLKIDLVTTRAVPGTATLPYLVAVIDANETILKENVFDVTADASNSPHEIHDQVTVLIPTYDPKSGGNFGVLVGFKLTKDQLDYNRAHKR
jgi:hypothetical protein